MTRPTVLLVNPNLMRPPIAPIGLEYLVASLRLGGYEPVLCDLTFAEDWAAALSGALADVDPVAVGVTVRNIDDAYFASQDFILAKTRDIIGRIMQETEAPVVLGGVGFSFAPREVLCFTGAQYGIVGEGEGALPRLLDCIASGGDVSAVPGAVYRTGDGAALAPTEACELEGLPIPARGFADTARYFAEGGQAGVETKRGCNHSCIYCVEPAAKGRTIRMRTPESVVAEFSALLEQGADMVHLCDSEFNLPPTHAHAVCEALTASGLAQKVRWYAYGCPAPFDADLAKAMARAGCVGMNFGVDHGDLSMLRRLGRNYGPEEIEQTAAACRSAGLAVMFDLLFGSPGETRETLATAIDVVRKAEPDRVGLSCGVRLYPHTPLTRTVQGQGPLQSNPNLHGAREDNDNFLRPIFFVEANLGGEIHGIVSELVAGDPMFLHADPSELDGNYNYNDNSVLANAIRAGERGAYWDILRRI